MGCVLRTYLEPIWDFEQASVPHARDSVEKKMDVVVTSVALCCHKHTSCGGI